jgi:putative DNA primase/helicase
VADVTPVLDTVLAAYDAGICTVRARADGSKYPVGRWKEYQSKRPDRREVEAWFRNGHAGWGAVCGAVSGNLEMLELEGRAVAEGLVGRFVARIREAGLEELLQRITDGYTERTPSGGIHWLYRCAEIANNTKLASRPATTDELAEKPDDTSKVLIETRGEGGFVVLAPSNGTTHPTGKPWTMKYGDITTIATITPDERRALHAMCREFDQSGGEEPHDEPVPPAGVSVKEFDDESGPWDEFNDGHTCHAVLLAAGFVQHSTDDKGNVHYTRPGKDRTDGSSATVYADLGTCTIFSTSVDVPAEYSTGKRRLKPWQLHVALNYSGDYKEASRVWRRDHPRGERTPPPNVDPETGEVRTDSTINLPDSFYDARPELAHISQAARSRLIGRDALLGVILARVAAISSHAMRLPAIVGAPCGLTFYVGLVGPAGMSKTSGATTGKELLPCDSPWVADMLPIGSGEGLIECLFDVVDVKDGDGKIVGKEKRQTRHGAVVYIDEGAVLTELAGRRGSTLLPTIRSAYTHGTIGQTNASSERRRILEGDRYVYGLIMGIQPQLAGPILDDAPAGTPQRFVWLSAADPDMPDEPVAWPGPLTWEPIGNNAAEFYGTNWADLTVADSIQREIRADRLAVMRGATRDPGDAHRMLVRLKVAALLAILARRTIVGITDWELAGTVMATSNAVKQNITTALQLVARDKEQAATDRHVRRELTVDNTREANTLRSAARSVARVVRRHDQQGAHSGDAGCTRKCMTTAIASKHRALVPVDDVIAEAERRDWIVLAGERWTAGKETPS